MKYGVYSIYDKVSGQYDRIACEVNDAAAIRSFKFLLGGSLKELIQYRPADISLYRVGSFDTLTGASSNELTCIYCYIDDAEFINITDGSTLD